MMMTRYRQNVPIQSSLPLSVPSRSSVSLMKHLSTVKVAPTVRWTDESSDIDDNSVSCGAIRFKLTE